MPIPLDLFFKSPEKVAFKLSPLGDSYTFLKKDSGFYDIYLQNVADTSEQKLSNIKSDRFFYHFWANDSMVLYLMDNKGDEFFHIYALNIYNKTTLDLTPYDSIKFQYLAKADEQGNLIVGLNKRSRTNFDVYELNINTGKLSLRILNNQNITRWIVDHDKKIRAATATDGVNEVLLYRESEDEPFKEIFRSDFKNSIEPEAFTEDNKSLICLSNLQRDKKAVVVFSPLTRSETQVLYENSHYDVQKVVVSDKTKRPIFCIYTDWKVRYHFLDEEVESFFRHVQELLPNDQIEVNSLNDAEDKFLLRTYNDRSLGKYYYYDFEEDELITLADISPWLKAEDLSEVKPIKFVNRNNEVIYGYLTLPKHRKPKHLPLIVKPHGGPWFRDTWTFNTDVQFLANRGYAVLQVNYRGSTGYGTAYQQAGFKAWGTVIQDDIYDGVRWLIDKDIVDSTRIGIFGFSFGGYSAIQSLIRYPEKYACGVSYCGLSNIFTYIKQIPPQYKPYLEMTYEMVGHPVKDAQLLKDASPSFNWTKIQHPLMIAQGRKDPRVDVNEMEWFYKNLQKNGQNIEYYIEEEEGHGYRNEKARTRFYHKLDSFLAQHLQPAQ